MVRTRSGHIGKDDNDLKSAGKKKRSDRKPGESIKAKSSPRETSTDPQKQRIIRDKLYHLISRTKDTSTICPSQVARAIHEDHRVTFPDWRGEMDPVRAVVWEEVKKGHVQVTQGGQVRTYNERNDLKGPIRVRRGPNWDEIDPNRTSHMKGKDE